FADGAERSKRGANLFEGVHLSKDSRRTEERLPVFRCYRSSKRDNRQSKAHTYPHAPPTMKRFLLSCALFCTFPLLTLLERLEAHEKAEEVADLIIYHAKVLTVDEKFSVAEAVAVKGDRIQAVGSDEAILKLKGPKTKLIDAHGRNVLPGL